MFYNLRFGPYLEVILFAVSGLFLILTLLLVMYLLTSYKRSRGYAKVLEQETEIFDALTATAAITASRATAPTYANNSGATETEFIPYSNDTDMTERLLSKPLAEGMFDPSVIAGAYTIEREIGGGAMSRTFEIRSKKLGNPWFLKFVSSKDGRLANEEHILKLLNHHSLPRIVDVFHREEGAYLIETLVEGVPLNTMGETKIKLSQYILLDWFEQIAQALNYLHSMRPTPV
jgi:hypothetical protein